jgi:hypothetical protein
VAYARFYGKRLPSVAQWFQAVTAGEKPQEADKIAVFPDNNLPVPSPIMEYKPNGFGIRGLNANIGEWGLRSSEDIAKDDSVQIQHEILGAIPGKSPERRGIAAPIHGYPWEALKGLGLGVCKNCRPKPAEQPTRETFETKRRRYASNSVRNAEGIGSTVNPPGAG